ncbi:hypothetical protein Lesp02_17520 [Lentzea sp. NBRC 105346]|uniref:NACHT domain-containing protein n=1 Tax=Lentzea sp. NBRC 105346 TaxID=3032205 RepID=UPI0024A14276|nr:hypothetical protein [Lentzea sp. NBRC 105346]GLZ29562.1 hypothetical protein Lesp02_17520 [Lentzea sp. NBRC 105346]
MEWDRISRTARITVLVGICVVVLLLLLPAAIKMSTGAAAPEYLGSMRDWLWPAAVGLSFFAVGLLVWERVRGGETSSRSAALDRVESRVRARLHASLATQSRIKLALARQPRVSVRVAGEELDTDDLESVFNRIDQPIVLLGSPGSGRTTLMLDLCLRLIKRARYDPEAPVPVVVDLATWSAYDTRGPMEFGAWLQRELTRRYGISRSAGTIWLRRKRLVVLVDGLDEVTPADRAQCEYDLAPYTSVLCSSRPVAEFVPVYVQPLTRGQLQEYIAAVSPRLDGLQTALDKEPAHWDTLTTPLMLNLVALTYRDREADFPSDPVAGYIVERLAGQRAAGPTIRALKFLARLKRPDLAAPARLPHRRAWIGLVPTRPLWLLFVRGVPAALAGAVAAVSALVGLRFGVVPGAVCAVASCGLAAWVMPLPHVFRPPGRAHGVVVCFVGFLGGLVGGGLAVALGLWLAGLTVGWPPLVSLSVVLVVTFVLALGMVQGQAPLPWAFLITAIPGVAMIWTGPSVLTGLCVGLVVGIFGGVFCAAAGRVWDSVLPAQHARFVVTRPWWVQPLVPLFGLACLVGLPRLDGWLAPSLGLLAGLMITPTAARDYVWPFDSLAEFSAELLSRPLVVGELSLRRRALLHLASDRLLLSHVDGEYRFPHSVLRDHLASCDPIALSGEVRRRS